MAQAKRAARAFAVWCGDLVCSLMVALPEAAMGVGVGEQVYT